MDGGWGDAVVAVGVVFFALLALATALVVTLAPQRMVSYRVARRTTVAVAVALTGVLGSLIAWSAGEVDTDARRSQPSDDATVHADADSACRALDSRERSRRADASDDRDQLSEDLAAGGADVVLVGLSTCRGGWVVHVAVDDPEVAVPAAAGRGTPVLVFLGRGAEAF